MKETMKKAFLLTVAVAYFAMMSFSVGCTKGDHDDHDHDHVASVGEHDHAEHHDHDHDHDHDHCDDENCECHDHDHDHGDHDHDHDHEGHGHVHPDPTYKQFYAGFPGHKYAVEIVTNDENDVVTAYLTNAHYEPIAIKAEEIQLQYTQDSAPQSQTLAKSAESKAEGPLVFTLEDGKLKSLLRGAEIPTITVLVEVDGVPFTAELKKFEPKAK